MSKRDYPGVRNTKRGIAAGTVAARLPNTGTGPLKQIPLAQLAQRLIATGAVGAPGLAGTPSIADSRILANISGAPAAPVADALSAIFDHILGSTEGQILQRGASAWQILAPGTVNQILQSGGAAALNSWSGLSAIIDAVFGNTEGNILQRGASTWQVLAPGTVGQVLKSGGAGALNSWGSASGSFNATGAWSSTTAYNPFDVAVYEGAAYLNYAAISAPTGAALQWIGDVTLQTISTTNTTNDTAVSTGTGYCDTNPSGGKSFGKWYFEFTCSNLLDNNTFVGIAIAGRTSRMGGSALGPILTNFTGSGSGSFAGLTNNKRGAVAVDLTNKLFWITADVTASPIAWNGSTSNSPGAGTGGVTITTSAMPTVYPYWETQTSASQKCILVTTAASFSIPAIPSGFSTWNGATTPNNPPDEDSTHWIAQGNTYAPGGRLSLTSNVAVQTADVVGGTTIYYVPYIHRGLGHLGLDLAAQISLALDSNSGHTGYHQSGKNFDIFVDGSTGTPRLVTGPAWTSDTVRSASIDQTTVPGLWTNTATMTIKFDTSSSTYSALAGTLLYVGSFRASANGQTTMQFQPAAASGGSNTIVGLYNAYNKVPGTSHSMDSTASWTYGTGTWRSANNSISNRVSWLDGLGDVNIYAYYTLAMEITPASVSQVAQIGVDFNSTSAVPETVAFLYNPALSDNYYDGGVIDDFQATLGFNFAQAVEYSNNGTTTFYGHFTAPNNAQLQRLAILFMY